MSHLIKNNLIMRNILIFILALATVSCTLETDSADLSSRSANEEVPSCAIVTMTISQLHANMFFAASLPSFEAVIGTETYSSDGFVLTDGHYEASIFFPCSERTLQTITFNLTDEDTSSITLHCVPLNPEKPTVLDFELFLCNIDFNVSINPSFESEMQS